jgi:hypothetical protein
MIVDDEAVISMQLEDRLQSMEYDVVGTASSAEESVSMARVLRPDLILMDIVMQGKLDGIDAAKKIKADMDIPIIFLTAYTDDRYIKRAMSVEPFGYIVKPFRENEIRANIEIALYKRELERKQKQAEEKIRRLFFVIEHNPYMIMIMDIKGNIEFVNNKFSQITNYAPGEIIGKNILLLQSDEESSEVFKEMKGKVLSDEEWRGELCVRKKDGTPGLKYTVALPVKDIKGDIISFVLVKEEIAKRKNREEQLLKSEKLNIMRTITAGVAHEFNNILAVVQGSAELLEGGFEDETELKNGLHDILNSSEKGAGIVRNMITFTSSDRDVSDYIFLDLKQLIIQAIDSTVPGWRNIAHTGEIKYEIDKNSMKGIPDVFCDPLELGDVFTNIINNALDAMPDGGCISFGTWSSEDTVFVSISDTGKGMSEEVKRKIFDPFFTTRRPQRTGLGMSIAYSVMERHDGRIEVESELGKATTITLCIPANKGIKQQKLSSRPARGLMVKGLNILVVDDKKEICNILDKFFSDVGHTVKTVNNGTEAIELAKREDYDLVLCDLLMIDVTGYAIKALNDLDKVPKIGMLTDCDVNLTSAEKNALTVDFIINKPLKLLELANHVNALFNDI